MLALYPRKRATRVCFVEQAVLNALILSESVYKAVDHGIAQSAEIASQLAEAVPSALCSLRSIQWSVPSVRHQYMLGESVDCLYCCFIGTKFRCHEPCCTVLSQSCYTGR